ncbi:hypothetical protein [Paludisphaera rhizosphaerae]|uniref:hypothetical protein n=1 Tax=Paludisphaera rhizosphaerae TaxID=2711216 RepID=UPI0013EC95FA|nr:hypothetical protein [Paludisphaera rhizosphaerae]
MAKKKPYFIVRWPAPPDVKSPEDRRRYWALASEVVLKVKDADLAAGLASDGRPLGRPSARWLRRRRSKMLPVGVPGDPSAPLFQPGNDISRVRSLLTARGLKNGVQVYWRYDANIHDEFGVVLAHWAQKKGPRWDVLGMPAKSIKAAKRETDRRWGMGKTSPPPAPVPPTTPANYPLPLDRGGRRPTTLDLHSGSMEEIARASAEGRFSGWRTADELKAWWREGRSSPDAVLRNAARTAPVVRQGISSRALEHTWKATTTPPAQGRLRRAVNWVFAQFGI